MLTSRLSRSFAQHFGLRAFIPVDITEQLPLIPLVFTSRESSKQTKINFGSNRNKPKQHLFRVCFGLFRETKYKNFGLFRCFELISKQPKQTEMFRNKPKQTETTLNFLKNTQIYSLLNCLNPIYKSYVRIQQCVKVRQYHGDLRVASLLHL
jgi:hypothetical protein